MEPISTVVPLVERQTSHREFVEAARPDTVMLKATHARRLVKDGLALEDYYPEDVSVITTTTVTDDKLRYLHWKDPGATDHEVPHEWETVRDLEPAYHVPTDHSDYADYPVDERAERVRKTMEGTVWMQNQIDDHGVSTVLIPLLKGTTREEREICYSTFDSLDVSMAAVYATTYFTRNGNQFHQLVADLEEIQRERPGLSILLIGLLSPHYAAQLPENVAVIAGQNQWRDAVSLRDSTPGQLYDDYHDFHDEVVTALRSRFED